MTKTVSVSERDPRKDLRLDSFPLPFPRPFRYVVGTKNGRLKEKTPLCRRDRTHPLFFSRGLSGGGRTVRDGVGGGDTEHPTTESRHGGPGPRIRGGSVSRVRGLTTGRVAERAEGRWEGGVVLDGVLPFPDCV